jgi:predicted permease
MFGIKLAIRTLTKTPFVTAVAVLSLALGIGANAAIFSLFDQMLLRSLPVQEPDRLVNLANPGPKPGSQSCGQAGGCEEVFSYLMFKDLEASSPGFNGIAAHVAFGANLAQDGVTLSGEGMMVSGSYFGVLGVQPVLGRLIGPDDDREFGGHFVAVLSHDYWQESLGSDPSILNKTLVVNGHPMTVVGVAPRGFMGTVLGSDPDVFVPITMRSEMLRGWDRFENRRVYWAYLFGRLAPSTDIEQASTAINTVYSGIIRDVEAELQEGMSDATMERFLAKELVLTPGYRGQSTLHSEVSTPLKLLFAITGLVLIIACANIANLLLARGANRGHEMAIRGSLGASRRHLAGQLITESLLLAVLGGVASLVVAGWTLNAIGALLPPDASEDLALRLNPGVVMFTGLVAVGTGFLFGFYPALHSTRTDLVSMLKANTGQPSGARSAARFRSALVTAQIALSMALLVAAGLFVRSLLNVTRVDLGMQRDNIITFGISPELNGYEPEDTRALFARAEEEFAALPGVTGVSAAMVPILTGNSWGTDVHVQGWESGPDIDSNSRLNQIGPEYFSTLGIPLMSGREFTPADAIEQPKVAIVNEAFTRKFNMPGPDAVGMMMSTSGEELDMTIVGVVQDAKYNRVKGEVPPIFFTPYRQNERLGFITFYVRTSLPPAEILRAVPTVIAGLDPNLPVEELKTLDAQVKENVMLDRLISTLSAAFAVLATLLAAVGLYGVLAFTVAQRTREIGLRMALGAGQDRVRAMVLKQVSGMTILGGIIGVVVALALGRAAQSLLFGLDGWDLPVVGIVAVLLALVAFGAGYLPARRASKVDPMVALRYE